MNAIKQGIITPTTKSALEELEREKETLALSIAREKIERPVIGKEEISFRLVQYADIDVDDPEQRQGLITFFLNSVFVYDDKLVVSLNYKDGDKCIKFDETKEMLDKKKNSDNHTDYQSSSLDTSGDPYGNRTRVTGVRGRCLNRLTNGPHFIKHSLINSKCATRDSNPRPAD